MSSEFINDLKKIAKEEKEKVVEKKVEEDFAIIIGKVVEVMTWGEKKFAAMPVEKHHAHQLVEKLRKVGFKTDLHPYMSGDLFECCVEWD